MLIDVAFAFLYFLSGVRGWLGNSLDPTHDPITVRKHRKAFSVKGSEYRPPFLGGVRVPRSSVVSCMYVHVASLVCAACFGVSSLLRLRRSLGHFVFSDNADIVTILGHSNHVGDILTIFGLRYGVS